VSSSCYEQQHAARSLWGAADPERRSFCLHSCVILGAAVTFSEILAAALNQPLPLTVYVQN
jgi:hypothetical protein